MGKAEFAKLLALARVEWRLRQQSTFLGFLWTMLHPALLFAAMYAVFEHWMGSQQSGYAMFLVIGIVEWNFFASATNCALTCLQHRAPMIKNYPVSPETVLTASLLSVYFSHLLEMGALVTLVLLSGVSPSLSWLWLAPLDILYLSLAAGTGLLLAWLSVFYFDIARIWSIALMAGFFLTPIFYPLSVVGDAKRRLLEFSPLTAAVESLRLILSGAPPLHGALLCLAFWAVIALIAGFTSLHLARAKIGDAL
jgi:ABC-type polysaccharide/polyol phosphate export permease